MTKINSSTSTQQKYPVVKTQQNQTSNIQQDKSMSTTKKVLIGAGALAAIVVGGLLWRNSKVVAKTQDALTDNIDKVLKSLQDKVSEQKANERFCKIFDPDTLQRHIDDAIKLPEAERLNKLNKISETLNSDRRLCLNLTEYDKVSSKFLNALPDDMQQIIKSKDQLKATQAYIEYGDNLFHPSTTAGKTIQESLDNALLKNHNVKPHSYDITKEYNQIATGQYRSQGYTNVTVRADNMIADCDINHKNTIHIYNSMRPKQPNQNYIVWQGEAGGKPFVQIDYDDLCTQDARNCIRLLSPDSNLTAAQKDLLKLKDTNSNIKNLQNLTGSKAHKCEKLEYTTNYNAILSVIQDLASKVKPAN